LKYYGAATIAIRPALVPDAVEDGVRCRRIVHVGTLVTGEVAVDSWRHVLVVVEGHRNGAAQRDLLASLTADKSISV
jgi:hypothetical protein